MIGIKTNNSIYPLRGKFVKVDGQFKELKATDKLLYNGKFYSIGFNTVAPGYQQGISDSFDWLPFQNGQEPQGTKYYVTPEGAGLKEGSNWENAHGDTGLSQWLDQLPNNSIVYFMEGDYTSNIGTDSIGIGNLSLYGGFARNNPSWASRHTYKNPTRLHGYVYLNISAAKPVFDGFCCNYIGSNKITANNLCMSGDVSHTAKTFSNCLLYNVKFIGNGLNSTQGCTNCRVINCTYTGSAGTTAYLIKGTASKCIAVNCGRTTDSPYTCFGNAAYNCLTVNVQLRNYVFLTSVNCTAVNSSSVYVYRGGAYNKNCVSYNNVCTRQFFDSASLIGCAGNTQDQNYAVVLDPYNQVARFVDTGTYKTPGYQDVGPCPDPTVDLQGFYDYVHSFGDWHLQASSLLVRMGVKDTNVTQDLDGRQRPDHPSIGCYEGQSYSDSYSIIQNPKTLEEVIENLVHGNQPVGDLSDAYFEVHSDSQGIQHTDLRHSGTVYYINAQHNGDVLNVSLYQGQPQEGFEIKGVHQR